VIRDQLKLVWVALLLLVLSETLHHVVRDALSLEAGYSSTTPLISELIIGHGKIRFVVFNTRSNGAVSLREVCTYHHPMRTRVIV